MLKSNYSSKELSVGMKIGISNNKIFGNESFSKLKSFGFDYCDYNMSYTEGEPYILSENDFFEYLHQQKMLADEAGVTIWQVHGPWRCPPKDSTFEDRAERFEKMSLSIKGAAILGAKYWVVHPIMPYGTKDTLNNNSKETREINLEFMSKLLQIAKQEGVTICLENMPFLDFSMSSPSTIAEFVNEINDPFFKMCLDTGHANMRNDWLSPSESINNYSDLIKVLHVHDNNVQRDEHLAPFFGTIDWKAFSKSLKETNFDGVLSLECTPNNKIPYNVIEDVYNLYYKTASSILEFCD